MKKVSKYNSKTSIKDLFNYIELDSYTRQTLATLFRCFLETIIENRYPSVIFARLKNSQGFQGLLNRLKYTESKVYAYSDNIEGFNSIASNHPGLENDEFLVIIAERFSACIYWNESNTGVLGLCEGFCSMNPEDTKSVIEFLQEIAYNENVEKDLSKILQDRRNNEKFTTILRKLITNLESGQRDLICANTELKDVCEKTVPIEKHSAIDQLCSTIAHELRNPLGMIGLHAKIISKNIKKLRIKDQEVFESLMNSTNSISCASQNFEALLTELTDYSKPMFLEKTETDINKTLLEVINLVKPSFESKNVSLSFENLLNENFKVAFDKTKVHQAVLNIVKNALEVSKSEDKVKIFVDYSNENNSILIKISDEGSGIAPEFREKIFTPYFTTKKTGTGLGLARARKIMEAHGGSLLISSTDTEGTTFVMSLPIELIYISAY
ncbi:MAG: HAMP domain-containing sensor histidine kinase [bacterium]